MKLNESQREWGAFGALVLVLAVVVVGVALLAPGIFARVTGAFFAAQDGAPPPVETVIPTVTIAPTLLPTLTPPPEPTPTTAVQSATAVPTQPYVVQPGDTLSRIATLHSTTVALLVEINRLANPNQLVAGTTLLVPRADP